MQREIKFRAWDPQTKKFDDRPIIRDGKFLEVSYGELLGTVSEIVLEQYIGLKDKNGKEIYEGDIIRTDNFIDRGDGDKDPELFEVIWNEDMSAFTFRETEYMKLNWYVEDIDLPCSEIIGNVHQEM